MPKQNKKALDYRGARRRKLKLLVGGEILEI
jgi:hypothetical protein